MLLVVMGVLGLFIGSFLTVMIERIPRGDSIVRPGSRCPFCGTRVRPRHNVPLLGWMAVRGRCVACSAPLGVWYLLVELGCAVLFVALVLHMEGLGLLSALPAYLYLAAIGVALAVIDLRARRLPNAIVLPSYPVLAVLLTASAAWQGDWWSLARAGIGAAALFGIYFTLAYFYPAGMGFGDVKLAGILGGMLAYLSWSSLAVGAFAGFFIGAVVGIMLMVLRRAGRKTPIPYGPSMIAGAFLAIFAAGPITHFYVDNLLVAP